MSFERRSFCAINPLLSKLNKEDQLSGIHVNRTLTKCVVSAFADDITVFIKNKSELKIVYEHFKIYDKASGASLNHSKTESVWIGAGREKENINIDIKKEIKILGIYINNINCAESNWSKKNNRNFRRSIYILKLECFIY